MTLQVDQLLVAAAVAGVTSHLAVFRRFEAVDEHPSMIVSVIGLGQLAVLISFWKDSESSIFSAYISSLAVINTFIVSLLTSILVYRLFWHPLRSFPGPLGARVSGLWAVSKTAQSGLRWHHVQGHMREQYGDFVRTGPRELIIFDSAAIPVVNGPTSKFIKGPWYGMVEPSLHTIRDKKKHNQRRRMWDRAFSIKALNEFRPIIQSFADTLLSQISKHQDEELMVTEWFHFYAYDVMSFMAFGISMDTMEAGKPNWVLEMLEGSVRAAAYVAHIPWVMGFVMTFPSLLKPLQDLTRWTRNLITRRKMIENPRPDLFQYIADIDDGTPEGADSLMSDVRLAISAGSDTTSTALSLTFLHLANNPTKLKKLQDAVDELYSSEEGFNATKSGDCVYLEAVINEVLRLHPAVPSGVQRVAPPGGVNIGDKYIPGGTIVVIPMFHVNRDERNFSQGAEFIPERWYSQPELVKDNKACMTFLTGAYSCVGKGLAMMSLRTITSQIVKDYNVKLVPGFDVDAYLNSIEDHFTTYAPPLKLIFSKRS